MRDKRERPNGPGYRRARRSKYCAGRNTITPGDALAELVSIHDGPRVDTPALRTYERGNDRSRRQRVHLDENRFLRAVDRSNDRGERIATAGKRRRETGSGGDTRKGVALC